MKHISSNGNTFYKELLKLVGSARQRKKVQQTILDGTHLLAAYHASGNKQPQHLLVNDSAAQNREVAKLLEKFPDVPLSRLDDSLFAKLSDLKTPGCILALIDLPQQPVSSPPGGFCLFIEDVQDPGNLGSILRSAAAAGCDEIFLSKGCADVWSPKVLRAGMGGHFALSIHESVDLSAAIEKFDGKIFATAVDVKQDLYSCDFRGSIAFVIGNEGAGLSDSLLATTDQHVTIPMLGCGESLNVAAATAVCLFEAVRQRRQLPPAIAIK